jgi:hypothetical protein
VRISRRSFEWIQRGHWLAGHHCNVDWFDFWLQDYEDPYPTKAAQYARWRELRMLQQENDRAKAEHVK